MLTDVPAWNARLRVCLERSEQFRHIADILAAAFVRKMLPALYPAALSAHLATRRVA